jgi:hypothetical protein
MDFCLRYHVHTGSGGHRSLLSNGYGGSFPGVKRPECEDDHSPPSSAVVKTPWSYTFIRPYIFMASCLIKHSDFAFTFY